MKPSPYVPTAGDAHWRCWAIKTDGKRCNNKRPDRNTGGRWFTCASHRSVEEEAKVLAEKSGWFNPRNL